MSDPYPTRKLPTLKFRPIAAQVSGHGAEALGEVEPTWIPCPGGCDDMWCTAHGMHTADCPCPPIEFWIGLRDPYRSAGTIPNVPPEEWG